MNRTRTPLMQLLVLLALVVGLELVTSLIVAVLTLCGIDMMSRTGLMWTEGITQLVVFALPVLLISRIYYRDNSREFLRADFGGSRWLLGLAGIVVLLLITPLNDRLTEWNDGWNLGALGEELRMLQDKTEQLTEAFLAIDSVGGLLASLIVVALIPAVCEELLFRCGVQNLVQRWLKSPHWAVLITAVIFSVVHGEVFAFVPRVLLGVLLGYLYYYGRSMVPNMLVHFANNGMIVLLFWLSNRGLIDFDPEEPMTVGWLLTACCTLAAVVLFVVTFIKSQKINR